VGNPLKSEAAAFRWLVSVVVSAAVVVLVAEVVSSTAGFLVGLVVLAIYTALILRGLIHMLGSPEEDGE
jgi:uncharacterized membrane protein YccC